MRLDALSAGTEAARGRFNGTVHSVFDNACNVALDDGRLLALLAPRIANVPHGVRIDMPPGFAFASRLIAGRRVGCRADRLRFAGTGNFETWVICLGGLFAVRRGAGFFLVIFILNV